MTLIQQIKDKQIAARKSGDSLASLYTTLLGEASIIGKNAGNRETTDVEVVAVVKKFIKNIDETVQALTSRGQDAYVYMQGKTGTGSVSSVAARGGSTSGYRCF